MALLVKLTPNITSENCRVHTSCLEHIGVLAVPTTARKRARFEESFHRDISDRVKAIVDAQPRCGSFVAEFNAVWSVVEREFPVENPTEDSIAAMRGLVSTHIGTRLGVLRQPSDPIRPASDTGTSPTSGSEFQRAIEAGASVEWLREFRGFEAQRTITEEKRVMAEEKRRLAEEVILATRRLDVESRRLDLEILRLQRQPITAPAASDGEAPAEPVVGADANPRPGRAAKRPRTGPSASEVRNAEDRVLDRIGGTWSNMVCLSAAVWTARPPADDRTLMAVFAAVVDGVKALRRSENWRVRFIDVPGSREALSVVYVNDRFDRAGFVSRFWTAPLVPSEGAAEATVADEPSADAAAADTDCDGPAGRDSAAAEPPVPRPVASIFRPANAGDRSDTDAAERAALRDGPLRPLTWDVDARQFFENELPPMFRAKNAFEAVPGPSGRAERLLRIPDRSAAAARLRRILRLREAPVLTVQEALNTVCGAPHDAVINYVVACLVNRRWGAGRTADKKGLYRAEALPHLRCAAAVAADVGIAALEAIRSELSASR